MRELNFLCGSAVWVRPRAPFVSRHGRRRRPEEDLVNVDVGEGDPRPVCTLRARSGFHPTGARPGVYGRPWVWWDRRG